MTVLFVKEILVVMLFFVDPTANAEHPPLPARAAQVLSPSPCGGGRSCVAEGGYNLLTVYARVSRVHLQKKVALVATKIKYKTE